MGKKKRRGIGKRMGREDGEKGKGEERGREGDRMEGEKRREDGSNGGDSKQNITQMSSTPLGNISMGSTWHTQTYTYTHLSRASTPHPGRMVLCSFSSCMST